MLKVGAKRRRTAQQIADEEEAKRRKEQEVNDKFHQIQMVEQENQKLVQEASVGEYSKSVVMNLLDGGYLQDDGNGNLSLDPKFKQYAKKK